MKRIVPCTALTLALLALPQQAFAEVLEGDVPSDGPDHFFVDFDVPPGTQEIEVRHESLSGANILDFGLDDPKGPRGWGGGNSEPIVINAEAASRSYVPGPIAAGRWRVVVGKAKIVESPARYRIEVDVRTKPTLARITRSKYLAPPARDNETRYYAGDLHVHSLESGDASATLDENIALAKQRGLDWIEISDHNTVTQLDFFNQAHERHPDFLLVPGIEVTTYQGHANAIGATKYVDQRVGQPGNTIDTIVDAVRAQGAIFSINHPVLDLGNVCIGCAWKHDVEATKIGGVEIGTLGYEAGGKIFTTQAIAFWDALLDKGAKVAAVGGSDDHRAGTATGLFAAKLGSPTTLVRANELTAAAIVDGIAHGRTVVKLNGPDDAMVELEAATDESGEALGFPGDTIGVRSVMIRARVTHGIGQTVRFVKDGVPEEAVKVESDPFVHSLPVTPGASEERWRAEALVEDAPRTVTSHIWLHQDASGPVIGVPRADDGCNTSKGEPTRAPLAVIALSAFAIGVVRRRRT